MSSRSPLGPFAALRVTGYYSWRRKVQTATLSAEDLLVPKESVTITDNRTGQTYELPITEGTIRATDLRQIKVAEDDFGMMTYDPAFMNTAACRSAITYIDGDRGILRYRGYPIEQLAEQASFLEVAYLLGEGELPNREQLAKWEDTIKFHTYVHTNITKFLEGFRYDAHPMGMLLGVVGALSTFYPDAKHIEDPANRYLQRVRLLAKLPTIAAFAFRHSRGLPYEFPRNDLDYIGNFVNMTFSIGGRHQPNKVLQRALEILLILHADHVPRGSVLRGQRRHRGAVRPAARGRQRGRAPDAGRDRGKEEHPRVHREGEGRFGPAHGVWPPGVQVVRPAGQADQESCL
jgi:hypothetical protein